LQPDMWNETNSTVRTHKTLSTPIKNLVARATGVRNFCTTGLGYY